jgi:hypothetical protein
VEYFFIDVLDRQVNVETFSFLGSITAAFLYEQNGLVTTLKEKADPAE